MNTLNHAQQVQRAQDPSVKDYEQFRTIIDQADRRTKRNKLNAVMGQTGKAFNYFVIASLHFFYTDGSKQINIINDLLMMAEQSNGYNSGKLAAYLMQVIPHKLSESNKHGVPPKFGKKNGDYPTLDVVQQFVNDNPRWAHYGRKSKASDFNIDTYLANVVKTLKSHKIAPHDFAVKLSVVDSKVA